MNTNNRILFILLGLLITVISCGKKYNEQTDFLSAGKSILFDNVKYNLAWTSHPSPDYYKQEYLSENDTLEKFKKLILLDVITGKSSVKEVVDSKVAELNKMKESDPMVNYDLFQKDGEVMLDFLLNKSGPDTNDPDIVERNVYRYKTFTDANGAEGVLMFGVSERAYGNDIDNFLITLKGKRFDLPDAVGAFTIPEIKISK